MVYSEVIGVGRYLPEKILTNAELEKMVDTSDEWIKQRTGIEERRIAEDCDDTSVLGLRALKDALANAEVRPEELELIIDATNTARRRFPCSAGIIHAGLGTKKEIPFFDISAGCTGINYAIATADSFVRSGMYKTIAVVANEKLSEVTDYTDRNTCVLFGDAGGAMILRAAVEPGFITHELGGDGKDKELLRDDCHTRMKAGELQIQKNGEYVSLSKKELDDLVKAKATLPKLYMDGPSVFKFAVPKLYRSIISVLEKGKSAGHDISAGNLKIIPHQANCRIIDSAAVQLAKKLGISFEEAMKMFYVILPKRGNTSTASQPDALYEAIKTDWIRPDDYVVFVGFGAGMTWGANLYKYNKQMHLKDNTYLFAKKNGDIRAA
ncbi:MAG: beta-ketoacyl-ACP synthase 3 [Candidatus Woesearchaeota archaeon]